MNESSTCKLLSGRQISLMKEVFSEVSGEGDSFASQKELKRHNFLVISRRIELSEKHTVFKINFFCL